MELQINGEIASKSVVANIKMTRSENKKQLYG